MNDDPATHKIIDPKPIRLNEMIKTAYTQITATSNPYVSCQVWDLSDNSKPDRHNQSVSYS
jgi:hypothetical protein